MTPLLESVGLEAFYGEAQALFGVDFTVDEGEAVALLGRNGAGKSTLFLALMGLVDRRAKTLRFADTDLGRVRSDRAAALGIGYVPETRRVFAGLTVRENLECGRKRAAPGAPACDLARVLDLFPALQRLLDRPADRTSGGEQQMLAIARTLMGQPRLLLLDEPSEGLAPVVLDELARVLASLRAAGLTVVLAEQNLSFAAAVAERVCIVERGRIVHTAAMTSLMADADGRRRWLAV